MRTRRALVAVFVAFSLVCTSVPIVAGVSTHKTCLEEIPDDAIHVTIPREKVEATVEAAAQSIESAIPSRGPQYHYETVWLPVYEDTPIADYAGNQLRDGYNFPGGGLLYYLDIEEVEISGEIEVSLPAPYDIISVSAYIGTRSVEATTLGVNVPADSHFYKIFVIEYYEVHPYVVYQIPVNGTDEDREIYYTGYTKVQTGGTYYAKRVD